MMTRETKKMIELPDTYLKCYKNNNKYELIKNLDALDHTKFFKKIFHNKSSNILIKDQVIFEYKSDGNIISYDNYNYINGIQINLHNNKSKNIKTDTDIDMSLILPRVRISENKKNDIKTFLKFISKHNQSFYANYIY